MYHLVISDYGPHVAGYLQVFDQRGDRVLLCRPFNGAAITQHLVLGEDRVLCLSSTGKLALLELPSGEYLASGALPPEQSGTICWLPEREMFALWNETTILFFSAKTLEFINGFDGAVWQGDEGDLTPATIREDISGLAQQVEPEPRPDNWKPLHITNFLIESVDGRVSAGYHYPGAKRGAEGANPFTDDPADQYGVYDINPRAGMIRRSRVNRANDPDSIDPLVGVSPCGRFAARINTSRLVRAEGMTDGLMSRIFKSDTPRHRDIQPDGLTRYAVEIDIWALAPLQLVRTVPVGWFPVHSKLLDQRLAVLAKHSDSKSDPFEHCLNDAKGLTDADGLKQIWAEFRAQLPLDRLFWEDDSLAFWLTTRNGLIRRVGLDGNVSPYVVFERFAKLKDWPFDPTKAEAGIPRDMIRIDRFGDEISVETGAGLATFPMNMLDTEASFVAIAEANDSFSDAQPPQIEADEVFDLVTQPIPLDTLTEEAANEVFTNLCIDLADGLDGFLRGAAKLPGFELGFLGDGQKLYEYELFGQADAEGWKLASSLRPLLEIWFACYTDYNDRMGEFCPIAGPSDPNDGQIIPAMAMAMRHLILEDAKAIDLFRQFLALRDGPNEDVGTDLIGMEYFAKNEFRKDADVAFGIYFAMIRNRDGRGPMNVLWNEHGTLGGAYEFMRPEEFAALAYAEIRADHPGLDCPRAMQDALLVSLIETLQEDPNWGAKASQYLDDLREGRIEEPVRAAS